MPREVLESLGIKPRAQRKFILADGSAIVLGIVSLESVGLMLDPIKREVRRLPLTL